MLGSLGSALVNHRNLGGQRESDPTEQFEFKETVKHSGLMENDTRRAAPLLNSRRHFTAQIHSLVTSPLFRSTGCSAAAFAAIRSSRVANAA